MFMLGAAGVEKSDSDYLAQYRNQPDVHGLYEIREAAREFLKKEGRKKKHEFTALDPDIRILVPRCAVPLRARWAHKTIYHDQPGIDVICKKSVNKKPDNSWNVFVPLYSPQIAEEGRRAREAMEQKAAAAK